MKIYIRSAKYIQAMSKTSKELASWIEDHTFPTMCAIAQVYLFPDAYEQAHWRSEVWSKFDRMFLNKKNKLPSAQFIYDNSFGANAGFVGDAVQWAIDHETNLSPREDIDLERLTIIMDEYFKWISTWLSSHRVVSVKDVFQKLDELGL